MKNFIVERDEELPILVSAHMEKRLKQRKGFNRKAIKRYVVDVLKLGETIQWNIENDCIKIVNSFKGDEIIFYIEKGFIYLATILTPKSIMKNVSYHHGIRKKREYKFCAIRGE